MTTKNLNLAEILKNVPQGTKLYSPLCGECELVARQHVCTEYVIEVQACNDAQSFSFTENGYFYKDGKGECLLFPSRDNRDWSTFNTEAGGFNVGDHIIDKVIEVVYFLTRKSERGDDFWAKTLNSQFDEGEFFIDKDELFDEYEKVEKFDPSVLKPFDRVLVRNCHNDEWFASFFSHLSDDNDDDLYVATDGYNYKYCIPYNDETRSLVGTSTDEPDFYKID